MRTYFSDPKRRQVWLSLGLIWLCGCAAASLPARHGSPGALLFHALASLSVFPIYGISCRLLPYPKVCLLLSALGMLLPAYPSGGSPWQGVSSPLGFFCLYLAFRQLEDRSFRKKQTWITAAAFTALSLLFPSGLGLFAAYLAASALRCLRERPRRGGWLLSLGLWCSSAVFCALRTLSHPGARPQDLALLLCPLAAYCGFPAALPAAFFRRYCPPQRRQLFFTLLCAFLPVFAAFFLAASPWEALGPVSCAFLLLLVLCCSPEVEGVRPNGRLLLICSLPAAGAFAVFLVLRAGAAVSSTLFGGLFSLLILSAIVLSALSLLCLLPVFATGWGKRQKYFYLIFFLVLLSALRAGQLACF
ncbi:MAG: hypothetical protein MR014_06300 [Oscillospiraceae bacterium]|nr:hypothetical protein [Oscillospiraceae bacterium]